MGYLQFPPTLTEEELMLQASYSKLQKKKKALQDSKAPNPEPDRGVQNKPKRSSEAREAREMAQKLIKSGVIGAIRSQKNRSEESFKRSRGLERKLNSTEKTVSSYKPFSASQQENKLPEVKKPKVTKLSDNFVPSSDPANKVSEKPEEVESKKKKPNVKGHAIFVYCRGGLLTEDILREHFSKFGDIVLISVEKNSNKGFVTYNKTESTEKAITQMNGTKVLSMELQVSMAKIQPIIVSGNNSISSSVAWASVASTYCRQGPQYKNDRGLAAFKNSIFD